METNNKNNNDTTVNYVAKFELPQVVNDGLKPLATSIGNTLTHIWEGFTVGIDLWYGKKTIERDLQLEKFEKQTREEMNLIKEENLQEPKMFILGPTMEAAKYYFEEDQYCEMFSKLIAGAFDSSKNDIIHPFFIEAIKQMKSNEAEILKTFKYNKVQPIAEYHLNNAKKGNNSVASYIIDKSYLYFLPTQIENPDINSAAISNLVRLGFLSVSYSETLTDENNYSKYYIEKYYLEKKEKIKREKEFSFNYLYEDIIIHKGLIKLTPLGNDFISVCIK